MNKKQEQNQAIERSLKQAYHTKC